MHSSINLSVKVALSPDLTSLELGVYVRSRALLRTGRKAFNVADFKQLDGEELVRSALEHLLELGYVVHKGGGWYSAAKHPVKPVNIADGFIKKIAYQAEQSKKHETKKYGRYGRLCTGLVVGAEKHLGYEPAKSTYTTDNKINRACYRNILKVISKFKSTVDEFVWFVFQQDWQSIAEAVPSLRLLGSNNFLSSFEGYLQNKDKLDKSDDIFDIYDTAFGARTARGLPEMRAALKLKTALVGLGTSPRQFFDYASSIPWRAFDGAPPLTFLTSGRFLSQFRSRTSGGSGGNSRSITAGMYECYLGRVLDRLRKVPQKMTHEDFENHNWVVAEAIFEPLSALVSKNGSDVQLVALVARTIGEKHLPVFGSYVITERGRFTPLAVYWIAYAAYYLDTPFYPSNFGNWRDVIKDFAAEQVDLKVLELDL